MIGQQNILKHLPYQEPFLFVDSLDKVDEDGITGHYTFRYEAEFYRGHFKEKPVTPGVLLTECCAQIGLVCLGIYLVSQENTVQNIAFGLSSSEMEFLIAVMPGEKVEVVSEKIYYRFGKLKCKVRMMNAKNQVVCRGTLSGMQLKERNG